MTSNSALELHKSKECVGPGRYRSTFSVRCRGQGAVYQYIYTDEIAECVCVCNTHSKMACVEIYTCLWYNGNRDCSNRLTVLIK